MSQIQSLSFTPFASTTPPQPVGTRIPLGPGALANMMYDIDQNESSPVGLVLATLQAALLGEHEIMCVKNAESSTAFAYGDCVVFNVAGTAPFDGVLSPASATTTATIKEGILGLALGPCAAGSYCWVATKGVVYARAGHTGANQLGLPATIYDAATAGQMDTGAVATDEEVACAAGIGLGNAAATIGARFLIRANL